MAYGIKPGDEVLLPDFTFIATAEVVSFMGAVPVFVDVKEDTLNIDPVKIREKISPKTKGIIAVSLYGQCADFDRIGEIADEHGLWVIEDGAQSYGALYKGRKSCTLSEIGTTSFFPAKPLGCYGDGGAVFTDNDDFAGTIRMLLNHGQEKRYQHKIIGINSRLDALQAAILLVKLKHFDAEMEAKGRIAGEYSERLKGIVETPKVLDHNVSVWAQYTVRSKRRDEFTSALKEEGIPTAIHYPIPLHRQEAFSGYKNGVSQARVSQNPAEDDGFPVSEEASRTVFSLPMHPFLERDDIERICAVIKKWKK
jgi:UDP-2-acetamido-2-deoxy-ribo-hexuluronate aminotransferase